MGRTVSDVWPTKVTYLSMFIYEKLPYIVFSTGICLLKALLKSLSVRTMMTLYKLEGTLDWLHLNIENLLVEKISQPLKREREGIKEASTLASG